MSERFSTRFREQYEKTQATYKLAGDKSVPPRESKELAMFEPKK